MLFHSCRTLPVLGNSCKWNFTIGDLCVRLLSLSILRFILMVARISYHCLVCKSCPTLLQPWTVAPPGSSVHGISQARILEWVAISFSRGSSWPRNRTHVSWIGKWILYQWATREDELVAVLLSFLQQNITPLCGYTTFYLSIIHWWAFQLFPSFSYCACNVILIEILLKWLFIPAKWTLKEQSAWLLYLYSKWAFIMIIVWNKME